MNRCQCQTSNGKQCIRQASKNLKNLQYCWQHQNCKHPYPMEITKQKEEKKKPRIDQIYNNLNKMEELMDNIEFNSGNYKVGGDNAHQDFARFLAGAGFDPDDLQKIIDKEQRHPESEEPYLWETDQDPISV